MKNYPRAYRDMVGTILSEDDQRKFEWAIGAVLTGGPPFPVMIFGQSGSGKSTLTKIIRHILTRFVGETSPRVSFVNWDHRYEIPEDLLETFVISEVNMVHASAFQASDVLFIQTTGERMPVNRHHVLMNRIESELDEIAQICIDLYADMGEDYYSIQENQA